MQVDLTGYGYRLFLEFWKIAPGPSKIAPGSGKNSVNQEQTFTKKLAPGSRDLISRLGDLNNVLDQRQFVRPLPKTIVAGESL